MLRQLIAPLTRLRIAIAESDLRWMEAQAPAKLAQARARVLKLRTQLNQPATAQAIANQACREKRAGLAA